MRRPIIGLNMEDVLDEGRRRVRLAVVYVDAVLRAGGVPLLLPPVDGPDAASLDAVIERLDGVVLTGGDDYDPATWGEAPDPRSEPIGPRRDRFDRLLAERVLARVLPILGICGGMQLLNIVRGGGIMQHIEGHRKTGRKKDVDHPVALEPGSLVSRIFGGVGRLSVNSGHHQAVGRLGRDLRVSARAEDGIIEAVEDPAHPFLLGLQWHPERLDGSDGRDMTPPFNALLAAARGD